MPPQTINFWLAEMLEPSLLIGSVLTILGGATAAFHGVFDAGLFLITLVGVVLIQNAVNLLNDYHDYVSGVDARTVKTPLTGGSRLLTEGRLVPRQVYWFGVASLLTALIIGSFFVWLRGLLLLPIILVAAMSTYFYTTFLARHYIGEFFAGLNLGPLVVLGTYFAQTGAYHVLPLAAGISPGILVTNVLLLHQFPDAEADAAGGRRNIVTKLGRARASRVYALVEVLGFAWNLVAVAFRLLPVAALLALAAFPLALKAILGVLSGYYQTERLLRSARLNILAAFCTMVLLSVALILSRTLGL